MAKLQEMTQEQITDALQSAIQRQVPVTVTLKRESAWTNCHTKLLAVRDPHVLLGDLFVHDEEDTPEIAPAEKVGLSFKLKHYKHIFTVTAVGTEELQGQPDDPGQAIAVCWPNRMHRLQRRAFIRAEVPEGRVVRASFWVGGRENEPTQADPDRPVWSGRLNNISAGGFQVVSSGDDVWDLVPGETVGVRLAFEAGSESVYADAQYRRVDRTAEQILLGFQFVGLAQDRKGRQALQYISGKVAEYHRHGEGSRKRR
ncbi:MAG: PilZ domain-containing protein [Phycisphaerae bacterium]|jgi:c-di-GMP-binding flagellar brake protein YcgR|nr:PilZ domain-containing protein [Phycisphaerae bacterium]